LFYTPILFSSLLIAFCVIKNSLYNL